MSLNGARATRRCVPREAERRRHAAAGLRDGAEQPGKRPEGDVARTSWVRRAPSSCGQCRRTASTAAGRTSTRRRVPTCAACGMVRHGNTTWTLTGSGRRCGLLHGDDAPARRSRPNAVMFYGGIGYSYNARTTLPLTQTNLAAYPVTVDGSGRCTNGCLGRRTGGLIVIATNAEKVGTGFTARRAIVEDTRCNDCHQELGTFTEDAFHAGQRNDGTTCSWCHTPNRSTQRLVGGCLDLGARHPRAATSATSTVQLLTASTGRRSCIRACWRVASSATSRGRTTSRTARRRMQSVSALTRSTSGCNSDDGDWHSLIRWQRRASRPGLCTGVDYGAALAATNLVTSPTVTVCSSCHDSNLAISHMKCERWHVLRGPQRGARPDGAVLRLPCDRQNRGHQGGSRAVVALRRRSDGRSSRRYHIDPAVATLPGLLFFELGQAA